MFLQFGMRHEFLITKYPLLCFLLKSGMLSEVIAYQLLHTTHDTFFFYKIKVFLRLEMHSSKYFKTCYKVYNIFPMS